MNKIYISGKITGDKNFKAKFADAKLKLSKNGWENIVNPVELPECDTWQDYMIMDIKELFECSHIFMLRDWKESKGAKIEHSIALNCGLIIYYEK